MTEKWLPIPNYEGVYEVSDHGRIYSYLTDKILKPGRGKYGHCYVMLAGRRWVLLHRIVASVFDVPGSGNCINHIDNDPGNNHVSNLEWCTPAQNLEHARKQGRLLHAKRQPLEDRKEMVRLRNEERWPLKKLAARYGLSEATICYHSKRART